MDPVHVVRLYETPGFKRIYKFIVHEKTVTLHFYARYFEHKRQGTSYFGY